MKKGKEYIYFPNPIQVSSIANTSIHNAQIHIYGHYKSDVRILAMQGLVRAVRFWCEVQIAKPTGFISLDSQLITSMCNTNLCHRRRSSAGITKHDPSATMPEKGLENTTVAQVLMTKGEEKVGSWLWCHADDTVYDAVKHMAKNNIGSLVVVKPGDQNIVTGILTERDYLRKVIVKDRSSKYLKVKEIMTDEDKLLTVTSDTNILRAMQIMTENQIRHIPVVDGKLVGMISMVDVVRAVLEQQTGEVRRLNDLIQGHYY